MSSLKKNFIYSTILTTANYIFPLITFPYISRVLGVENVGLCSFIDSIINYFVLFATMGMNVLGIREIARIKNDHQKLNATFSSLFALNFLSTLFMLLLLIVVTVFVPTLRENMDLMLVGGVKLLSTFLLIEWFYKGIEEFKYITIRTLIVRIAYVVSVFLFVNNKEDYVIYFALTTLMIVVNALINIIHSRKYVTLSFYKIHIQEYSKPFIELGIYKIMTSLYTSFNIAFLGFVASEIEVGYYSTAIKLYAIIMSIFSALTGVMLPRMSSLYASNDLTKFSQNVDKSSLFLRVLFIPIIIFFTVNADGIINIVAGEGYEGAVLPMRIMMLIMLVVGYEQILIEQVLMPMKKDKAVLYNSIAGGIVGIILNIALVPLYKSIGSTIVLFFSELTVFFLAYQQAKSYIGKLPIMKLVRQIIYYIPCIILFLSLHSYYPNSYWCILAEILILICYSFCINQYFLKEIDFLKLIKSFKSK